MTLEEKIVKAIISDISDRSGIGDEWGQIDKSTQIDIKLEWQEMVKKIIDKEFCNKENKKESKGTWHFEVSSGYDGWRCDKCATWVYDGKALVCDCDKGLK